MTLWEIGKFVLTFYLVVTFIILIAALVMEYINQRKNEIIRHHASPTFSSILNTVPEHLLNSLGWPKNITRYF